MDDARGQALHNKSSQGIPLTPTEQVELKQWYHIKDTEELNRFHIPDYAPRIQQLQEQIDVTLAQIIEAAQELQELRQQNQALRSEILKLERRLLEKEAV
jgi:chromosome segregation ATPase